MKILGIVKYVFLFLGVVFLVTSLFTYKNSRQFKDVSLTAKGRVTDLVRVRKGKNYSYTPAILFQTKQGKPIEFVSSMSSNPPDYSLGDEIEVIYDASRPERAKINSFFSLWGSTLLNGLLGVALFVIGCFVIFKDRHKTKQVKKLLAAGKPIQAEITSVHFNRRMAVGKKKPFQIHAQWRDPKSHHVHFFESENIWFDPNAYIKTTEVTIFIENNNPKKYYMDISFLPKFAE